MTHCAAPKRRHAMTVAGVLAAHAAAIVMLMQVSHTMPVQTQVVEIEAAWIKEHASESASPTKAAEKKVAPNPSRTAAPEANVKHSTAPTSTPSVEQVPPVATAATVSNTLAATDNLSAHATATSTSKAVTAQPLPEPKLELPSSSADYLNNPRPPYPPLSKRLGEQGKVVVRVLIETDGSASKAEIRTSSGYDRLDQTALKTVLQWRYVPGKRNGVPEAMWFNVPINFVLE